MSEKEIKEIKEIFDIYTTGTKRSAVNPQPYENLTGDQRRWLAEFLSQVIHSEGAPLHSYDVTGAGYSDIGNIQGYGNLVVCNCKREGKITNPIFMICFIGSGFIKKHF